MLCSEDKNIVEVSHCCELKNLEMMIEEEGSPSMSVSAIIEGLDTDPDGNKAFGENKIIIKKDKLIFGENFILNGFDFLSYKYESFSDFVNNLEGDYNFKEDTLTAMYTAFYYPNEGFIGCNDFSIIEEYRELYDRMISGGDKAYNIMLEEISGATESYISLIEMVNVNFGIQNEIINIIENLSNNIPLEEYLNLRQNIIITLISGIQDNESYREISYYIFLLILKHFSYFLENYNLSYLEYEKEDLNSILKGLSEKEIEEDYLEEKERLEEINNLIKDINSFYEKYCITIDELKEIEKENKDNYGFNIKDNIESIMSNLPYFFYYTSGKGEYNEGLILEKTVSLDFWEKIIMPKNSYKNLSDESLKTLKKYNVEIIIED